MAEPSEDVQVQVATNAAEDFVDSYYACLNKEGRSGLVSYYHKPSSTRPIKPDISINGNVFDDPEKVEAKADTQGARPQYDVHTIDCHVLNTNYNVGADDGGLNYDKDGKKISIVAMVSGGVKSKEGGEHVRGFTESITLVPNWDSHGPKAPKGMRKWLIASQNFRLVL